MLSRNTYKVLASNLETVQASISEIQKRFCKLSHLSQNLGDYTSKVE